VNVRPPLPSRRASCFHSSQRRVGQFFPRPNAIVSLLRGRARAPGALRDHRQRESTDEAERGTLSYPLGFPLVYYCLADELIAESREDDAANFGNVQPLSRASSRFWRNFRRRHVSS
jgi:hypothetical protein